MHLDRIILILNNMILKMKYDEQMKIYAINIFTGNRRHFYTYCLQTNKLEKQGAILGHHDEADLSNMVVSPGNKYFAFACKQSGYILVMG